MFDMGIGDIMNNAAALKEAQDDKRIEAMMFATEHIIGWTEGELHFAKRCRYMDVIQKLLENDYYAALLPIDFDVLYRLILD